MKPYRGLPAHLVRMPKDNGEPDMARYQCSECGRKRSFNAAEASRRNPVHCDWPMILVSDDETKSPSSTGAGV